MNSELSYHNAVEFWQKEWDKLEAEVAVLREALQYCRGEIEYRRFQIEGDHHIPMTGEMHTAIKMADEALTQTRAPLLLEVVRAADELGISDAVWEDDRISWVEVQIDKGALKQFDSALKKWRDSK